jgi:hypothetical protein
MGNGDGTFQPAVNYEAGSDPYSVAVGDFNRDGKLDLAVADNAVNGGTAGVGVLLGNGDGIWDIPPYVNGENCSGIRLSVVPESTAD